MPLDDDVFPVFNEVEQFRELRLGCVDAHMHMAILVHFLD